MKLTLKHVNIRSTNALDSWVEKQILALGEARQVDEANIELSHHADDSPAYEARVHLVTPGPDIFAEARDHTIRAAFKKVSAQLHKGIATRAARPAERARTRRSAPVNGRGGINS
jgi:ribosome-associated translation inhibitor RaiA